MWETKRCVCVDKKRVAVSVMWKMACARLVVEFACVLHPPSDSLLFHHFHRITLIKNEHLEGLHVVSTMHDMYLRCCGHQESSALPDAEPRLPAVCRCTANLDMDPGA